MGVSELWRPPTVNPYYLVISTEAGGLPIDLDEPQWMKTYADWLRVPSTWSLVRRSDNTPMLMVVVNPGDQPFYTAHHVGLTSSAGGNEIVAFGLGKKCCGGRRRQVMWLLPNGTVCMGDDVDDLGVRLVRLMGPIPTEEQDAEETS